MTERPSRFLLAAALIFASSQALAGFTVKQDVTYTASDKAAFTWWIGDKEFRVDVQRGDVSRSFVFNGRVFYVCAKLDKERIESVKKLDVQDKAVLASLEKGTCQDLSTDFSLRFFLSPYDAVGSAEAGAGFGASSIVADPEIAPAGSSGSAAKVKCANFSRTYNLKDRKSANVQLAVDETACHAPTIKWRQGFGKQLGMTLIRQPSGKQSYQTLAADLKKMSGMTLTAVFKVAGKDAAGKAVSRGFKLATASVKEGELRPEELAFPPGFDVLDPETVVAAVKSGQSNAKAPREPSVVIDILRAIAVGASPAAVLFGN